MANKKTKPGFTNESEERLFWETEATDSTQYLDWKQAEAVVLSRLKPSTTSISLRLPDSLLDGIRVAAHRRDVPYQSLIKVWLAERLRID